MFAFKIDVRDFQDEASWSLLKQALNVDSIHELEDTAYILINEERMKLPQPNEGTDPSISSKFIQNVIQVSDIDELYDLLDLHRGEAHKYAFMYKAANAEPKSFSL